MDRVKIALGFYENNSFVKSLECTEYLKNWDEVTISLDRADYTGIVRSVTSKFEFIGVAKDEISSYYDNFYLNTQIKINIYQLNEKWEYELIFQGDLDFSTLEMDEYVLYINSKDNSLSNLINSQKSTKYDIRTSEVWSDYPYRYDRMNILNRVSWTSNSQEEDVTDPYRFTIKHDIPASGAETFYIPIPLAYMSNKTYRCPFEYRDQANEVIKFSEANLVEAPGIIKAINYNNFRICAQFSYSFKYSLSDQVSIIIGTISGQVIAEHKLTNNTSGKVDINAPIVSAEDYNGNNIFGVYLKITRTATQSESTIECEYSVPSERTNYFSRGCIVYAESFGRGATNDFKCIEIDKLLSNLITKIAPYHQFTIEIDALETPCVLIAGEDMREIEDAKITTSFNDFADFMECCFGYTYNITNNHIHFGRRENLFKYQVDKTIENYSDLHLSQDTSLIYSKVKVGYNKQDYDNANGKNEFNFTNEYTTDVSLNDNTLSLISPYRADGYGFEFKVQEIENEVEDKTFSLEQEDKNETDSDIFVINAELSNDSYKALRYPAYIKDLVMSNGAYVGIDELFIKKNIVDIYDSGGVFANFYLTEYTQYQNGATNMARFTFSPVNNNYADSRNAIEVAIPISTGIKRYITTNVVITINWDKMVDTFSLSGDDILKYPISYSCYQRDPFNYELNPSKCAMRNEFLITPCTKNIKFASTEGSNKIKFFVGERLVDINADYSYGGSVLRVDKLTFMTSDNVLPGNTDGLVEIVTPTKVYQGWIIRADQNIGKSEPSEYEIILRSS